MSYNCRNDVVMATYRNGYALDTFEKSTEGNRKMEMNMAKDLSRAKFVKEARGARAWPQQQLADVAHVNLRTIQRLERDGTASFETLRGVAAAFDIDVQELNPTASIREKRKPQPKIHFLKRIVTGKELTETIIGADRLQIEHDEASDPRAVAAMKDVLRLLKGDVVRLYDADPVQRLQVEMEMSSEIKGLEKFGFYLFGTKRVIPSIVGKKKSEITLSTLFMSHAKSPKLIHDKNMNMTMPAVLPEIFREASPTGNI